MGSHMIVGDTVYAEPYALDLRTGRSRMRRHPVTGAESRWAKFGHGGCGILSASAKAIFGRYDGPVGYCDLAGDAGMFHLHGIRPGCYINTIPTGGLLLVPEASSGCRCGFHVGPCTAAFKHMPGRKPWGRIAFPGPMTPARSLRLNFGTPGDLRDKHRRIWLGYWTSRRAYDLQGGLDIRPRFYPKGWHVERNIDTTRTEGTPDPWLYATATRGLRKCEIPLLGELDGSALYTVRLHFSDPDNDAPGRRVFNVRLQGKTVLKNLDIVKETGGRDRALVKEFKGIAVTDRLAIDLISPPSSNRHSSVSSLPIIAGIECIRTQRTGAGFSASQVLLTATRPSGTVDVRVGNPWPGTLEGTLRFAAPKGFGVTPERVALKIAPGTPATAAVKVSKDGAPAAGWYAVAATFVRKDGRTVLEREIPIECLGTLERAEIPVSEDAYARRWHAKYNKGGEAGLGVCGGRRSRWLLGHQVTYLKFRDVAVQGRPVRLKLRLQAPKPFSEAHSARVYLVEKLWKERKITYINRPQLGRKVGEYRDFLGNGTVEIPLDPKVARQSEFSLGIDSSDYASVSFRSRESGLGPVLVVDFDPDYLKPAKPAAVKPGLCYDYYRGRFQRVAELDKHKPVKTGRVRSFVLAEGLPKGGYGIVFTGFIRVPRQGRYTFETSSNNGSVLWIGKHRVVDNDGAHHEKAESGTILLGAGLHPVTVRYFRLGGGHILHVRYAGPGIPKQPIGAAALFHDAHKE